MASSLAPPRVGPLARFLPTSLTSGERRALVLAFLVLIVFGGLVEMRSAFLRRPMTDLQVYLRAAWAVRTGRDLYTITDNNGWHYHYSPLFAILLMPLADAPAGFSRAGLIPFGVSVGLWYFFSLMCLILGTHVLARAIESREARSLSLSPALRDRRWWAMRVIPVVACLIPIGQTLMRGQVNLLLLAVLAFMIAAFVSRKNFQAGVWLALAICFKIIPAFLVLYPLARRNGKCLAGCAAGLGVGLMLIPGVLLGPRSTAVLYQEWFDVLIKPAFGVGDDLSRARELIEVTATESQAPVAVIHNWLHFDRATRPGRPSDGVRWSHRFIILAMVVLTFWAARRSRQDAIDETLTLGALILVMILASPVCHLHYFCLLLPMTLGLTARALERNGGRLGAGLAVLFGSLVVLDVLPSLPGLEILRDAGVAGFAGVMIWATALAQLVKRQETHAESFIDDSLSRLRLSA